MDACLATCSYSLSVFLFYLYPCLNGCVHHLEISKQTHDTINLRHNNLLFRLLQSRQMKIQEVDS